jgi:hypothetical protein
MKRKNKPRCRRKKRMVKRTQADRLRTREKDLWNRIRYFNSNSNIFFELMKQLEIINKQMHELGIETKMQVDKLVKEHIVKLVMNL